MKTNSKRCKLVETIVVGVDVDSAPHRSEWVNSTTPVVILFSVDARL